MFSEVAPPVHTNVLYFSNSLVGFFFSLGFSAQGHDALVVGIDLNTRQTAYLFFGQLGLDLGSYHRVLDERLRGRTVGIGIGGMTRYGQHHQRAGQ